MTTELNQVFDGPVHLPGERAYDEQRRAVNPALDAHPTLVVEALGRADVRRAVRLARDRDLDFSVQGTGHGTLRPADGALLLKTSRMSSVLVDPDRRVAKVGAGAVWSEVIAAAAPFGLAPLSGTSSSVGVAGYTFGGGVGWMSRKHGFAADSLLRVDAVTADGEPITATADRNADLFWAMRGGSGNFAVATSLEFTLYPVERAYGGIAYFAADRAADVLAFYRDWAPTQPDELSTTVTLLRSAPIDGIDGPVLAVRAFAAGDTADAHRALLALLRKAGRPVGGGFRPMRYPDAGTIGGTAPLGFELFDVLPDPVIDTVIDTAGHPDAPASAIEIRYWSGAMARPSADAGPVGHRDVPFSVTIAGPDAAVAPLSAQATGRSFVNFLRDTTKTATAYTPRNFALLREVKRRYDPDTVFAVPHTIAPAPAARQLVGS